jgi:hypothetical protein
MSVVEIKRFVGITFGIYLFNTVIADTILLMIFGMYLKNVKEKKKVSSMVMAVLTRNGNRKALVLAIQN